MAVIARIILMATLCTIGLNACGHKGKLKTPSQVEKAEKKKEKQR